MRCWFSAAAVGVVAMTGVNVDEARANVRVVVTGDGRVEYGAADASFNVAFRSTCPSTCEYVGSVAGLTVFAAASPAAGAAFAGWGGACAPFGTGTCQVAATDADVEITASFVAAPEPIDPDPNPDPPPPPSYPLVGETRLVLAAGFVNGLKARGWKLAAIAPARLTGRTLRLPIAQTGKVTIFHTTGLRAATHVEAGRCTVLLDGARSLVHHAGGLRLTAPPRRGTRNVVPLDIPAWHGDALLFRDRRTAGSVGGRGGKAAVGLAADVNDEARVVGGIAEDGRNATLTAGPALAVRLNDSSWDGLVEDSRVPPVRSGALGTLTMRVHLPAGACQPAAPPAAVTPWR
jgi:hypothetical protein